MYFRLAPGVECVQLDGHSVVLVSDWVRLKLEGESAVGFANAVLPALSTWRNLQELVPLFPGVRDEEWITKLRALEEAGVVLMSNDPAAIDAADTSGLFDLVRALGADPLAATSRLGALSVAIFGVEHVGAYLAASLAPLGLKRLLIVDPFLVPTRDARSWPFAGTVVERTRQHALVASLRERVARPDSIQSFGAEKLDHLAVEQIASQCDLMVGTFDRGFSAAHHWINKSALQHGIPALFANASGVTATVGPWVFPGESACFMCWRMRTIAAQPSFDKTMACEQHHDAQRLPRGSDRPTLPGVPEWAAGLLCSEALTTLLGLSVPTLANAVIELHGLEKTVKRHEFLHRPDCPSCAGIASAVRVGKLDAVAT